MFAKTIDLHLHRHIGGLEKVDKSGKSTSGLHRHIGGLEKEFIEILK